MKTSLYHVTSSKKFLRMLKTGGITPPVRAWENIEQAQRMSLSTGRKVIIRIPRKGRWERLDGHFGQAVITNQFVPLVAI